MPIELEPIPSPFQVDFSMPFDLLHKLKQFKLEPIPSPFQADFPMPFDALHNVSIEQFELEADFRGTGNLSADELNSAELSTTVTMCSPVFTSTNSSAGEAPTAVTIYSGHHPVFEATRTPSLVRQAPLRICSNIPLRSVMGGGWLATPAYIS